MYQPKKSPMKSNTLKAFKSVFVASSIIYLAACGGGSGSSPSVDASTQTSNTASTAGAYGAVKSSFTISALVQSAPTNANTVPFIGSSAMCSTTVAGANMCLGATGGNLGNPAPSVGGKCIYLNLGATEIPRGFDILFHANDGRIIQFVSSSSSHELTVGQNIAMEHGGAGLYQLDGKQWITGGNISSAITVTSIFHNQVTLQFNNLPITANTGFGAVGNISLNGSATIDCDPSRDSVN